MPSTSSLSSESAGIGEAKSTVRELPEALTVLSWLMRLRPSRTVTLVVESAKEASSGSVSVMLESSSPSATVPSHVRRVAMPPMTP